eukprot:2759630-Pyramimonas_sp.AAC.1
MPCNAITISKLCHAMQSHSLATPNGTQCTHNARTARLHCVLWYCICFTSPNVASARAVCRPQ